MFEGYKPTKAEKLAIETAYRSLYDFVRSEHELDEWAKKEAKGYGQRNDCVPLVAAKAFIVRWFNTGVENPNLLLRDFYDKRPAAIFAMGLGAKASADGKITAKYYSLCQTAVIAHENAFDRMMNIDKQELAKCFS